MKRQNISTYIWLTCLELFNTRTNRLKRVILLKIWHISVDIGSSYVYMHSTEINVSHVNINNSHANINSLHGSINKLHIHVYDLFVSCMAYLIFTEQCIRPLVIVSLPSQPLMYFFFNYAIWKINFKLKILSMHLSIDASNRWLAHIEINCYN